MMARDREVARRRPLRCVVVDAFKCPVCGSSAGFRVVKSWTDGAGLWFGRFGCVGGRRSGRPARR